METPIDPDKKPSLEPAANAARATGPQAGPMNPAGWTDPAFKGRSVHLEADEGEDEYVFKFPGYGPLSRYSREAMEGNAAKASRNLVASCLLYPSKAELETRLEEKPGLVFALANALNKETGMSEQFTRKN